MRISDWSSDVCSSDLPELRIPEGRDMQAIGSNVYRVLDKLKRTPGTQDDGTVDSTALLAWLVDVRERLRLVGRSNVGDSQLGPLLGRKIGRASGRERVCQYV